MNARVLAVKTVPAIAAASVSGPSAVAALRFAVPLGPTLVLDGPDRWLRAVLLITGVATAMSAATRPATAFDTTVEFTFEVALAVKEPVAVIVELPLTATSDKRLAFNVT